MNAYHHHPSRARYKAARVNLAPAPDQRPPLLPERIRYKVVDTHTGLEAGHWDHAQALELAEALNSIEADRRILLGLDPHRPT